MVPKKSRVQKSSVHPQALVDTCGPIEEPFEGTNACIGFSAVLRKGLMLFTIVLLTSSRVFDIYSRMNVSTENSFSSLTLISRRMSVPSSVSLFASLEYRSGRCWSVWMKRP